jgi:hypothetical protein
MFPNRPFTSYEISSILQSVLRSLKVTSWVDGGDNPSNRPVSEEMKGPWGDILVCVYLMGRRCNLKLKVMLIFNSFVKLRLFLERPTYLRPVLVYHQWYSPAVSSRQIL